MIGQGKRRSQGHLGPLFQKLCSHTKTVRLISSRPPQQKKQKQQQTIKKNLPPLCSRKQCSRQTMTNCPFTIHAVWHQLIERLGITTPPAWLSFYFDLQLSIFLPAFKHLLFLSNHSEIKDAVSIDLVQLRSKIILILYAYFVNVCCILKMGKNFPDMRIEKLSNKLYK